MWYYEEEIFIVFIVKDTVNLISKDLLFKEWMHVLVTKVPTPSSFSTLSYKRFFLFILYLTFKPYIW